MASVDHWPAKAIDCGELVSGGQIDVFSYKEHYLEWIQSIPVEGVVSMVSFSVDGKYKHQSNKNREIFLLWK